MKIIYNSNSQVAVLELSGAEKLIVRPDLQRTNDEVIRIEPVKQLSINLEVETQREK